MHRTALLQMYYLILTYVTCAQVLKIMATDVVSVLVSVQCLSASNTGGSA